MLSRQGLNGPGGCRMAGIWSGCRSQGSHFSGAHQPQYACRRPHRGARRHNVVDQQDTSRDLSLAGKTRVVETLVTGPTSLRTVVGESPQQASARCAQAPGDRLGQQFGLVIASFAPTPVAGWGPRHHIRPTRLNQQRHAIGQPANDGAPVAILQSPQEPSTLPRKFKEGLRRSRRRRFQRQPTYVTGRFTPPTTQRAHFGKDHDLVLQRGYHKVSGDRLLTVGRQEQT